MTSGGGGLYNRNREKHRKGEVEMKKKAIAVGSRVKFYINEEYLIGQVLMYSAESHSYLVESQKGKFYVTEDEVNEIKGEWLDREDVRSVVLHDERAEELMNRIEDCREAVESEYFDATLDDTEEMLRNLRDWNPDEEAYERWWGICCRILHWGSDWDSEIEFDHERSWLKCLYPKGENDMVWLISMTFHRKDPEDEYRSVPVLNYDAVLEDIDHFRHGETIRWYRWSRFAQLHTLRNNSCPQERKELSNEEKEELRALILELEKEDVPIAISVHGYGCYGGDDLFECDWETSRECFERLMEMDSRWVDDNKSMFANTLGYIYYYGRCNGGEPEYEKALKYFTMGAAGGIIESRYKLADMYKNGYAVPKNRWAANLLIVEAYKDTHRMFVRKNFECDFADAALRMGHICRDGFEEAEYDEYYYYTAAEYAIRKRMEFDQYGDNTVRGNIQKELKRIRKECPLKTGNTVRMEEMPQIVYNLLNGHRCVIRIQKLKKNLKINVIRFPNPGEDGKVPGELECYPEYGYCKLVWDVTFLTELPEEKCEDHLEILADEVRAYETEDGKNEYIFFLFGQKRFSFVTDQLTVRLKREKEES